MAANDILIEYATQIAFYVTANYSPADAGTDFKIGSPTEVVLTLSAIGNGVGRQSNKADLGAKRSPLYECFVAVDYTGETPAAGTIDIYWAASSSTTAATGNIAGGSGVDAAANDGTLGSITLAEYLTLLTFIGSLVTHDGVSVQNGFVGYLATPSRHGQIVLINNGGDAFEADNVEMAVFLNPVHPEVA